MINIELGEKMREMQRLRDIEFKFDIKYDDENIKNNK